MSNIHDLEFPELQAFIQENKQPAFRARQVWKGLHHQLYANIDDFTTLPASLKQILASAFNLAGLKAVQSVTSTDQETTKILYQLNDGAHIETVLMHYNERDSVCVSSQVGCAMACQFCATGQLDFIRNLSAGEIVEQVLDQERLLRQSGRKVTNVLIMGMGEPLNNYDATLKALRILNDAEGFNLGARRITLSTVGIVPGILKLAREPLQVNLAISLHAAEDALRERLLPVNKVYPIASLMDACDQYVAATNRRVTYEWALIEGVNDQPAHAQSLAALLKSRLAHVNLISLNPTRGFSGKPAKQDTAARFLEILQSASIAATLRLRRGIDINAGCGQLTAAVSNPVKPHL